MSITSHVRDDDENGGESDGVSIPRPGTAAEEMAAKFLMQQGLRIVARNYFDQLSSDTSFAVSSSDTEPCPLSFTAELRIFD